MKKSTIARTILIGLMMLASSAMALLLKPDKTQIEAKEMIGLESLIPKEFSGWRTDETIIPILPPPEVVEKVKVIYDEILARTYVESGGKRIMLTIAYGGDQTGRLRVHRPESCYASQGFLVKKVREEDIRFGSNGVTVKRLYAQAGARHEPITYWIRIGSETVTGLLGQRLVQLKSGLTGEIPDGLIFRISSIESDAEQAYVLHDRFIRNLLETLAVEQRAKLIGTATNS
ncbi:exosortase-associated protein EpsI, B-type [Nitrosovibrio sp. Nv17]|uniref:exosortase-associated protein EpsI, B-type n=1 Tax=Nitrosovibrio sp. Nv17 TaxID=1855339 RepID=UPI0009090C60|nr:exosortase-associated protein EpsI, B-type [Nitrosovibrio sp. Nv17]SFW40019.1 EpsI family protein [Nitrosovibrio sp. Nv17]